MTITRSFQWYSTPTADPAVSETPIGGVTSTIEDYVTTEDDVGLYFHVRGTATNSIGTSAVNYSNVIGPITGAGDVYTPVAGRIAPIETLFGDRPVPQIRYYNNELDILDAEEAGSDALHELMHAASPSTKAIASGRWSDPAVWSNGIPGAGYTAHVPSGFDIIYDVESSVQLKYLLIHGTFRVDPSLDTKIVVDTIHSMAGSVFQIGTWTVPILRSATLGKARFECVIIGDAPGSSTRLGLMLMGDVIIRGEDPVYRVTTANMDAGATSVVVDSGYDISKWRVGDEILIPSRTIAGTTSNDPQYTGPHNYRLYDSTNPGGYTTFGDSGFGGHQNYFIGTEFQQSHDEVRTISAIDAGTRTVTWTGGLAHNHHTLEPTRTFKDGSKPSIPAKILHMSRSIKFRSGAADVSDLQKRGHFMVMHSDRCDIRYAEFVDMARTSTDPTLHVDPPLSTMNEVQIAALDGSSIDNPNNVRGRYAVHIHGTGRRFDRQMAVVKGCVARSATPTTVPQPGWAMTHHNSRAAFEDNIIYNVRGAGLVSEIGTEIGQWIGNEVCWARGDGGTYGYQFRNMHIPNHTGHIGVAFENQARQIVQDDNHCTSCRGGWSYLVQQTPRRDIVRSPDNDSLVYFNPLVGNCGFSPFFSADQWGRDTYGIAQAQIPRVNNFSMVDGDFMMAVDERNHINRADTTPMFGEDWRSYGVSRPLRFMSYTWFYSYNRCAFWGASGGTAIEFGAKTAAFNFKDLITEGYSSTSTNHANSTGRWVDINSSSSLGVNEVDPPGDPRSPAVSMQALDSLDFTYVAPSFTLGDTSEALADYMPLPAISTEVDWCLEPISVLVYGKITDGLGDRHWPFWTVGSPDDGSVLTLGGNYIQPSQRQLVERCGCWNDAGTWKSRLWFIEVDRLTHDPFTFYIDVTHTYVTETRGLPILLANEMAGPAEAPTVPAAIQDIDKPWNNAASVNVVPPIVNFGGGVKGVQVEALPGKWTGHRDHFAYTWLRGTTVAGTGRKYTYGTADVGQPVKCQVMTHGTNMAMMETETVTVVDIPTPATIFGAEFKDMWWPRFATEASDRKGPGLGLVQDRVSQWKGQNGTVFYGFNEAKPVIEYDGWDGDTSLMFEGMRFAEGFGSRTGDWQRTASLSADLAVTNPHFWLVIERPDLDQHPQYAAYPENENRWLFWSDILTLCFKSPDNDPAQNKIDAGFSGGLRTDFPKGKRAIVYVGRGTAGRSFSVNNTGLVSAGDGSATPGTYNFSTAHPWEGGWARYRERARVFVDTPVVSPTQHAQMFDYLSKLFRVTP